MSLKFVRPEFVECDACRAKPGTPALCRECLERRELWYVVDEISRGQMGFFDKVFCLVWPPAGYTGPADLNSLLYDLFGRKPKPIAELVRICHRCEGTPNPECPEHGR